MFIFSSVEYYKQTIRMNELIDSVPAQVEVISYADSEEFIAHVIPFVGVLLVRSELSEEELRQYYEEYDFKKYSDGSYAEVGKAESLPVTIDGDNYFKYLTLSDYNNVYYVAVYDSEFCFKRQ